MQCQSYDTSYNPIVCCHGDIRRFERRRFFKCLSQERKIGNRPVQCSYKARRGKIFFLDKRTDNRLLEIHLIG